MDVYLHLLLHGVARDEVNLYPTDELRVANLFLWLPACNLWVLFANSERFCLHTLSVLTEGISMCVSKVSIVKEIGLTQLFFVIKLYNTYFYNRYMFHP